MKTELDILFIGDIVGRPGRDAVARVLDELKASGMPDLVVANGENAAGGFGLTRDIYHDLLNMGIGVITMGNHTWDKREVLDFIGESNHLLRPINYPEGTPGRGMTLIEVSGCMVAVINVMGRIFMNPQLDCPFRTIDRALLDLNGETRVVLVDVHAETTSEKRALGYHLDGRVSAVIGTHTHVQTADETILPGGTAYLTDAGMTGPMDSVIGMKTELAVRKLVSQLPTRLEVAEGPGHLNGVRLRVETASGRAIAIERLNYR